MKYQYVVIAADENSEGQRVLFAKDWDGVNGMLTGTKNYNPLWDGKQRFLTEKDIQDDDVSTGYVQTQWDLGGVAQIMVLEIKQVVTPKAVQVATKFERAL